MKSFWMSRFALLLCVLLPVGARAQAAGGSAAGERARWPRMILLMRHAEKPAAAENSPDLTAAGFLRADALPELFVQTAGSATNSTAQPRLPRPDVLFATARSPHSNRPVETLTPLALALHLPIRHEYEENDIAALAQDILSGRYAGKVVLVCWHHGQMQRLAQALGVADASAWKDTVFNEMWQIEYTQGMARSMTVQQKLMPADDGERR